MGRLFWKFFVIFWLAQVVTAAGVGVAIWVEHSQGNRADFDARLPPPPPDFRGEGLPPPPPGGMRNGPPRDSLLPPLIPLAAGSLVSLIFAALLAWYFAKPIRSLRSAFDAVAGGQMEIRVGAAMGWRNDELADLGSDFDRMADRLQSLLDAQRRLLHDVSHELRSPLARLQAAADLMRQQPERASELAERIERDTARMDALVGEILTLARLDAGMTGALDEEFDLGDLVSDVADDARIEADAKRCNVVVSASRPVPLRGNRELLHRAVENVVRNAVRHAPPGSDVEISAQAAEEVLRIGVADRGPGVFTPDLQAIFDPFFRSDPARATQGGYGLGLAIARRVVEAHGGRIAAANRPGGGLLVTLELPVLRA